MPEWVIAASNSIGAKSTSFEDEAGAEHLTNISGDGELGLGAALFQDTIIDQETDPDDQEYDGAGGIDDAIRALEEVLLPAEEERIILFRIRHLASIHQFSIKQLLKYSLYIYHLEFISTYSRINI